MKNGGLVVRYSPPKQKNDVSKEADVTRLFEETTMAFGTKNNNAYKLSEAEKIFADLYARTPNAVHAYNLANTISKFNKLNKAEKLYKFALKQKPTMQKPEKTWYYDIRLSCVRS